MDLNLNQLHAVHINKKHYSQIRFNIIFPVIYLSPKPFSKTCANNTHYIINFFYQIHHSGVQFYET